MASIKVKFRPSSIPEREGTIYYQIIHDRIPRQLLTDYRILPSEWDEDAGEVTCKQKDDRTPMTLAVREHVIRDIERLNKIIHRLECDHTLYTTDRIIEEFNRESADNSLFNFMQTSIARLKHNGKTRTSETYRATLRSFKKFRDDVDLSLDSLTSNIMEEYQAWLHQRGVAPNTISFYIRILRAVYNRAIEDEIVVNRRPFRRVYTGVEKTVKRALPISKIRKIKTLDLSMKPDLQFARDIFILSFMLRGMSFIDMALLKKSDLKDGHITYRRRKTGQQLIIQWTKEMQQILDRYPENPSEYLLPIIKNGGSKLRYAYKNMGEKINLRLKKIAEMAGISIPLTMYVARHSWASIAKAEGIPIGLISEGLGHEKESTTRIYLSTLDTTLIDRANSKILRLL
ncbi:MAG: site-specific integrase [Muribaculaceae bacterium]|nr:site-specific integrase [Muribaculaceae bacterium]